MLTGFGCTVPAIMGTRILDNHRDRPDHDPDSTADELRGHACRFIC